MRLTVGQIPVQPLNVTILDGNSPVNLATAYDSVTVVLVNPEGASVDTSAGSTQIVSGKVRYSWPTVTLFPTPGDYRLFVRGAKGPAIDSTEPLVIEVYREGAA